MATTLLRRSSAVWIPPRSVGERALVSEPSLVVIAGSLDAGAGARSSRTSLEALPSMKSAVLVFDARDVTLLPVRMPALSGARLYKALPNLLEDSLLQDAASCAFALGRLCLTASVWLPSSTVAGWSLSSALSSGGASRFRRPGRRSWCCHRPLINGRSPACRMV